MPCLRKLFGCLRNDSFRTLVPDHTGEQRESIKIFFIPETLTLPTHSSPNRCVFERLTLFVPFYERGAVNDYKFEAVLSIL